MIEHWKTIPEFNGIYSISSFGRLRSADRYVQGAQGMRIQKGRTHTMAKTINGYVLAQLQSGGVKKKVMIHRLVLEAFGPSRPSDKHECDHINRVRHDNHIENLRWYTRQQNNFNVSLGKNNNSGITGVSWHEARGKWRAHIMLDYKQKHLGLFSTKIAAAYARHQADLKYIK